MMKFTRREFVKGGVTAFTLSFVAPALLTEMANAQSATNRTLVVLDLDGGIDGLSVVVPYKDQYYYSRRPTISLPATDVLQIGTDAASRALGLHPRLKGLKGLFDKGKMAVVQRVGYENSSRSHFLGFDIWSTADPGNTTTFGWLGRYLDSLGPPSDPLYAWNTTSSTPRMLLSGNYQVPAIPSVASYTFRTNNGGTEGALEKATALKIASHVPVNRPHVALVQKSMTDALDTVDRVQSVGPYTPSLTYPNNGFGNALKMIAGAILKNVGTKIFFIRTGGFDTHASQQTRQGNFFNLMATLDDGLAAFYQDLANQGAAESTMIVTVSEFSRRVTENASGGTDHGAGNNVLVIGGSVKGGLYGTAPDLNPYTGNPTLESSGGDVHYETDFRSIYAAVTDNWLRGDSVGVLAGDFKNPKLDFV
jgi:uncharacterized protein (DUF1501 family)